MTEKSHDTLGFSTALYICIVLSLFRFLLFKTNIFKDTAKMIGIILPIFFKSKHFYIHGMKNVPRSKSFCLQL